jgi:hypothetical protein
MQASIPEEHRKSYEKLEGKAIYNQPQPHDTHRITHSIYHRRATWCLFMAFARYNNWLRLTNRNIWVRLTTLANGFLFSQKWPNRAYPSYPVVSISYFPIGVRGMGRRGDLSPPSNVTRCVGLNLFSSIIPSCSRAPVTKTTLNLPVLNKTRKNLIAFGLFKQKGHRTPSIIHV